MGLHLVLEPSRSLALGIVLAHGLAGIAALANSLPLWAGLILFAAVGSSAYLNLRRHFDPEVNSLFLDSSDRKWTVIRRRDQVQATPADSTVVTRWIVILHLDTDAGKIALPICRDSVDPESFRQLRVVLRCRRNREPASNSLSSESGP